MNTARLLVCMMILASTAAMADERVDIEAQIPVVDVPESPAQAILSGDIQQVLSPASPAEVGSALGAIVNPDGSLNTGIALDVSLRRLGVGKSSAYVERDPTAGGRREYTSSARALQFASRLSFSVATAALDVADDGTSNVGLGFGLRSVLWLEDEGDPILAAAYAECSHSVGEETYDQCNVYKTLHCKEVAREKVPDSTDVDGQGKAMSACLTGEEGRKALDECVGNIYRACLKVHHQTHQARWNPGSAVLGIAQMLRLPGGKWADTAAGPFGVWFTLAFPAGTYAHLALSASFRDDFDADTKSAFGGLRLRAGGTEGRGIIDVGFAGEGIGTNERTLTLPVSLGGELQIAEGVWMTAGLGSKFDLDTIDESQIFVLTNLSWGLSPTGVYPIDDSGQRGK